MKTTLNKIREHPPCKDGWETLLKYLGKTSADDEPLSLLTILDSNGLDHALWCFRAVEGFEKEKQLLAITYAREVEHLMPAESKKALDVFERYANGLATQEEFDAAAHAARADAYAACARAAAYAAHAARADAYAACADAAYAADADAAYAADADAAYAARAAADAAWSAAAAADVAAARAAVYAAAADAAAAYASYAAAHAARADARADARASAAATARSTVKAKQEAQLRELLERTCTQQPMNESKRI